MLPADAALPSIQTDSEVLTTLPPPENSVFYPALDGLRAVAVLLVFASHYLYRDMAFGWIGVDFFFVLSGFLITGILFDTRFRVNRFKVFYARRILRIFPLYYGVLLVCVLLYPVFHWIWHPSWLLYPVYLSNYSRFLWPTPMFRTSPLAEILLSLKFQPPFALRLSHLWSLAVEEQFYLMWPPIVFLVMDRVRLRNVCIAICVGALAARCVGVAVLPQELLDKKLLYGVTPFRVDALVLGGLLALVVRGPELAWVKRLAKPLLVTTATAVVVGQLLFFLHGHHLYTLNITSRVVSTVGYTYIDLVSAMVILLSLNSAGFLARIFSVRPLAWLGRISYGFYLFHQIPHDAYGILARRLFGTQRDLNLPTAVIAFIATLLLAAVSFQFYEKPFLRLKRHFV
jgi:peptidoglycan/LPS O-acetylase OafA/YrhL